MPRGQKIGFNTLMTRNESRRPDPLKDRSMGWDIYLHERGNRAIGVIKAIRYWTVAGLKEAKDFSDKGGLLKLNLPKESAEDFLEELTELGAVAEIKPSRLKAREQLSSIYLLLGEYIGLTHRDLDNEEIEEERARWLKIWSNLLTSMGNEITDQSQIEEIALGPNKKILLKEDCPLFEAHTIKADLQNKWMVSLRVELKNKLELFQA